MRIAVKLILTVGTLCASGALIAQAAGLPVLAKLPRGQWVISPSDGGPARRVCLGDPVQLVQLRHAGSRDCSRFVVEEEPNKVTVQYTCRGNGYGRTSIRRETNTLVQIESQGIAGGLPFQFRAEARRTGACR